MLETKIQLKIATPERLIIELEVDQVTLPTKMGEITILPNHIPLVTSLEFGELLAQKGSEDIPFALWGGFAEVANNQVVVLADVAEFAPEIELEKVEQAKFKAEELMLKKGEFSEEQYADLLYGYEKQMAQLKVAQKYKTKKYRQIYNIAKDIDNTNQPK